MPRPLPTPLRTGADVVHIPRLLGLTTPPAIAHLRRWLARTFHPAELPPLWHRLQTLTAQPLQGKRASLATHLAGRWALKEAAIKAHSRRRLFPSDVRIVTQGKKPEVWIAPPPRLVAFASSEVAKRRGLVGFEADKEFGAARLRRCGDEEYQAADGSVSHDGEYAFAVVCAVDEAVEGEGGFVGEGRAALLEMALRQKISCGVDEGDGEAVHVPLVGDVGGPEILREGVLEAFLLEGE